MNDAIRPVLAGQKALVVDVANEHSIAYGCAKAFRTVGAELAITWLNEKARPHVEPLARELEATITAGLDVAVPGQLEAVFDLIRAGWGQLDILVHSIAFAPKQDLQGGLLDCSAEGFAKAMDISCHSFVRMAKLAAPLMSDGGTMFAMSYYGPIGSCRTTTYWGGEGGARGGVPLSGLRTWSSRNPCARDFTGAVEDASGIGAERFRALAQ